MCGRACECCGQSGEGEIGIVSFSSLDQRMKLSAWYHFPSLMAGIGYWPLGFQKTFLLLSLFFPSLLKFVKTAKSKKELYFETWSLEYY